MTKNPEIRFAKSIVDYVFRWMAAKFLSAEAKYAAGLNVPEPVAAIADEAVTQATLPLQGPGASAASAKPAPGRAAFAAMQNQEDAPPCSTCGSIMVRSGACYKCANCGTTSGCA
jgi:ribonucleoside-diphosphate reductase alpha chain